MRSWQKTETMLRISSKNIFISSKKRGGGMKMQDKWTLNEQIQREFKESEGEEQ